MKRQLQGAPSTQPAVRSQAAVKNTWWGGSWGARGAPPKSDRFFFTFLLSAARAEQAQWKQRSWRSEMATNNLTTRSGYHSQSGLGLPQEAISPSLAGRSSHLGTEATAVECCVLALVSLLLAWLLASNLALRRAVNAKQREPLKRRVPRERTSAAQRWLWMVDLSLRCFWSVVSPFKRTLHHTR